MVINKRKKFTRQRGSGVHGWGAKKKHRGGGSRGGRGNAGGGKRSWAKAPAQGGWRKMELGKHGFVNKNPVKIKAVNLKFIDENLQKLVAQKLISEEKGVYIIELKKLGFNKVLGAGKLTKKFKITADYASKKALESVKKAGGEITLSKEVKG
jgi:large subunit ribosomal protein L15